MVRNLVSCAVHLRASSLLLFSEGVSWAWLVTAAVCFCIHIRYLSQSLDCFYLHRRGLWTAVPLFLLALLRTFSNTLS